MSFKKEIQAGPAMITIQESSGELTLAIDVNASLGGGEAAGVLAASAGVKVKLEAAQAIDLGFAVAKEKFPAIAGLLSSAQAIIDAELAKA